MEQKQFFDFRSEETFNLNDEYDKLFNGETFKPVNQNDEKLKDAESIIAELGSKYLEGLSIQKYEQSFLNLNNFLIKFKVDSEAVKSMNKSDRDKLFGYGKELFSYYQQTYSNLNFNFEVSTKEWHFIMHTLTKKLLYNGQEVFNFWELYRTFLEPTNRNYEKLPKTVETFVPICSIQGLILLSHLLMKHEEKGSTESFYHFKNILAETAKMTKLFNAYGVMLERITNRFNNWVNALNAMDGYNNDDRIDINVNESTE